MGRAFEVRKAAMAKTSAAKTKVYSRFGKEIYVAAKAGIPDPEMNVSLRRIIEKARANQVPADIIKRAIEKAKGGGAEQYSEVRYEGFGPGASTVVIDCLTDNVNRTYSEIRNCFNKSKSKIGVQGSVLHTYDALGILSFAFDDEEKMLEALIDHEVDVKDLELEDGQMTVYVEPTDLYKAKDAVESVIPECEFSTLENTLLPQDYVTLSSDEEKQLFERLTGMIDEIDDVQNVYHNVKSDE